MKTTIEEVLVASGYEELPGTVATRAGDFGIKKDEWHWKHFRLKPAPPREGYVAVSHLRAKPSAGCEYVHVKEISNTESK